MRKLLFFTIGFAAACAAGIYWLPGNWHLLFCLLFAGAALLTLVFSSSKSRKMRCVFVGCAVAFLWVWLFHGVYLQPLKDLNGETITTQVQITDHHKDTNWGIAADGVIKVNGKSYKICVYTTQVEYLAPGDTVQGNLQLEVTVGNQSRYAYHSADGTFVLGYLEDDAEIIRAERVPLWYFPTVLRHKITNLISSMFPRDTLPFAQALLLGDRSLLDYKTKTDLSVSGIRHVVAVSGLHVSILFSVIYFLFGYRRVVTPVVGWIVLLIFAAVTGFSPSVVRACVMHSLMLGSLFLQREYDAPSALAFAVLTMLVVNPLAVTSVALQLSVGCVVGILLFSEPIRTFLLEKCLGSGGKNRLVKRLKSGIAASVSMTLSTLITTTPLCAIYFGTISLIGIVTNLLTLWVVTIIFCGILIACVAGAFLLPVGRFIAYVVSWLIRYVLFIAEFLSSVPYAAVYTVSIYIVIWIVFCYLLLIAFFTGEKRSPWIMMSTMVLGLFVAIFASWMEPRLDEYRFSVLDVGQGQCILVQQNGENYIVDCGGDSNDAVADATVQLLLSQGIYSLDGIILTHYDTDHTGAVQNLLERIPAEQLYIPKFDDTETIGSDLINTDTDRICWVNPEETVIIDGVGITLFGGNNLSTDNEKGLCVLFQAPSCDILITGDRSTVGEKQLLEQTTLPDLEVLVAGHHGAKSATGLQLLNATMPEVVIISVGENNRYDHPSAEVMERLELFGCEVFRTDLSGDIVIRG